MEDDSDAHTLDLLADIRTFCNHMNALFEKFYLRF